jgi:hypothetical protein
MPTPHLNLSLLAAEQAQKHVTVNEALVLLDALIHLSVKNKNLTVLPLSPAEGDRYIVAASATGAWAGQSGKIALFNGGAWVFIAPREGFRTWLEDDNALYIHDGSVWVDSGNIIHALQNLSLLGVGATADATNPFSAKLNKALWTAKTVSEGGDGDLRYTLSKETASDTLSMLFQTGYSGRAEAGLTGDDNFTLKMSPNGSSWTTAFVADKTTGNIGIGSAPASSVNLDVYGAGKIVTNGPVAPSFKQIRNSDPTNIFEMTLSSATQGVFDLSSTTGGANMQFYCRPLDATSGCLVGFFRTTLTSGQAYFNFYRANNTSNTSARIMGSSGASDHSFVNAYAGNFGVGTASPSDKLTVAGNIIPASDNAYSCGKSGFRFTEIWAVTGTIQTSDERLKTDITDAALGLDFIMLLRPRAYKWRKGANTTEKVEVVIGEEEAGNETTSQTETISGNRAGVRTHYGLIAQEVKSALDASGCTDFAGYIKTDPEDPHSEEGLRYDQFIAPLIRAVQELSARVRVLEG